MDHNNGGEKKKLTNAAVRGILSGLALLAAPAACANEKTTPVVSAPMEIPPAPPTTTSVTKSTRTLPIQPIAVDEARRDRDCCKGKNDCKGQSGCATSFNDCKGKNECKAKGTSCDSSDDEDEATDLPSKHPGGVPPRLRRP